MKKNTKGPII